MLHIVIYSAAVECVSIADELAPHLRGKRLQRMPFDDLLLDRQSVRRKRCRGLGTI